MNNLKDFSNLLRRDFSEIGNVPSLAVGVSGGPDSLALVRLLSDWSCEAKGPEIHALTVDHGLRPESGAEALRTGEIIKGWPRVLHEVLRWESVRPATRLQEEARAARYALMAGYCAEHSIGHLFLAHHRDDQAETVLFRLAKGSGLDGLAGIRPRRPYGENLLLCRPLLEVSKAALVAVCKDRGIAYAQDPTNENQSHARPRLRAAREILEAEGLTAKRLTVTARRLARASVALDQIAEKSLLDLMIKLDTDYTVLNFELLRGLPEEIALRVVLKAIDQVSPAKSYPSRLERVEDLLCDLLSAAPFRKRTLGGIIFEHDEGSKAFVLRKESLALLPG
ncbi:MAG: tRNA lysidine(34) synthetase TilS [Alphaproteobacteria bacterium]|nr:tRNA lysidine(34) synthetase TilS [Alphaproteobacteria bacterium]